MIGGCSQWGFGASTMTLQQHFDLAMPQFSKFTASQGAKTLCISNMDVGCSQWEFSASTMTPQHHTSSAIPHFSYNSPPPAHVLQHKGAPISPSTASQGAKLFVYIQYGCGMQSMGVFSLFHDLTTSYRLCHTPLFLKFTPT